MFEWQISDQNIEATEELLLPYGAHFPEDARNVNTYNFPSLMSLILNNHLKVCFFISH